MLQQQRSETKTNKAEEAEKLTTGTKDVESALKQRDEVDAFCIMMCRDNMAIT